MFAVSLLYWWHRHIKQYYAKRLREIEILSYQKEIDEKDKKIALLEENNAYLGELLHKYRKIIPVMELAVADLCRNNSELNMENKNNKIESFQKQLTILKAEREEIMNRYHHDVIVEPQIGMLTIDAMLSLNAKNAKRDGIHFETTIDTDLTDLISRTMEEPDLLHLLSDLIENAFVAVKTTNTKAILVHFGKFHDNLLIEISDSGTEFDIEAYQHFGNEKYTSHDTEGGSGVGLMDIWKLKKKYKVSLYIYEYPSKAKIYTKKISFLFDGKKAFLLQSYRHKEIIDTIIRGDLHIFPYESD